MRFLLVISFLISGYLSIAQVQDVYLNNTFLDLKLINPSLTGISEKIAFTNLYSSTDIHVNEYLTSAEFVLPKMNSGFGSYFTYYHIGHLNYYQLNLSYSYFLKLKNEDQLRVGIDIHRLWQHFDLSAYEPIANDPVLIHLDANNELQKNDMNLGISYVHKNILAGLTVGNVLNTQFDTYLFSSQMRYVNFIIQHSGVISEKLKHKQQLIIHYDDSRFRQIYNPEVIIWDIFILNPNIHRVQGNNNVWWSYRLNLGIKYKEFIKFYSTVFSHNTLYDRNLEFVLQASF